MAYPGLPEDSSDPNTAFARALELLGRAAATQSEFGQTYALAQTLNNTGLAYYRMGDWENARSYWAQALPKFRALDESMRSFYEFMHTWNVTEEQAFGLVIYLRSLTPEGQGDVQLPTGFYNTDDINFSKLPASCNPDGAEYDPALCLLELPPICSPISFEFDPLPA